MIRDVEADHRAGQLADADSSQPDPQERRWASISVVWGNVVVPHAHSVARDVGDREICLLTRVSRVAILERSKGTERAGAEAPTMLSGRVAVVPKLIKRMREAVVCMSVIAAPSMMLPVGRHV
jgi:hypothetical protein